MTASELAAKLREWTDEFKKIAGLTHVMPDNYWMFLANRVAESGSIAGDPDVVTANIGGIPRRIKIVGTHGRRLAYEHADGARGMGIVEKEKIIEGPGVVTAILERLLKAGKVREG